METWQVVLLGIIEGLTEYIPVSSTGHLLLATHAMGISTPGRAFEVLIQLGAIMALLTVYAAKLWQIAEGIGHDRRIQLFVAGVVLAFLPAAVVGVLAHGFIKTVLFESPLTICISLVIGGIVLLAVDRMSFKPRYHDVMDMPPRTAFAIGVVQCLAMIPGVSRSGSTIVGGLFLGADKRTAAEFSFFLAMPTMAGAFAYDLYKTWDVLSFEAGGQIILGFVSAFVAGVLVVRYVLDFIARRGLSFFGWWRILVGGAGLVAMAVYA
jgi:undecaprenyl-diphosphatase